MKMAKYFWTAPCLLGALSLAQSQPPDSSTLRVEQDEQSRTITVYRDGSSEPILTQNAPQDVRPYLHPIVAPDGKGILTEYRPPHHPHQTGIFWGFKLLNGRDFFMKWQAEHYRRVSASVIQSRGDKVSWQTVYDTLDENGNALVTETLNWAMREPAGRYVLDLEWKGEARTDVHFGKIYVGGLFVRMPWYKGMRAEAVNAAGQRNQKAEQQRAIWLDVGMQVDGRDDLAHVAIFDHPGNPGFPLPWRVDSQLGFGPNRSAVEWSIAKGNSAVVRYRLIVYTGHLNPSEMTRAWHEFVVEH